MNTNGYGTRTRLVTDINLARTLRPSISHSPKRFNQQVLIIDLFQIYFRILDF